MAPKAKFESYGAEGEVELVDSAASNKGLGGGGGNCTTAETVPVSLSLSLSLSLARALTKYRFGYDLR